MDHLYRLVHTYMTANAAVNASTLPAPTVACPFVIITRRTTLLSALLTSLRLPGSMANPTSPTLKTNQLTYRNPPCSNLALPYAVANLDADAENGRSPHWGDNCSDTTITRLPILIPIPPPYMFPHTQEMPYLFSTTCSHFISHLATYHDVPTVPRSAGKNLNTCVARSHLRTPYPPYCQVA